MTSRLSLCWLLFATLLLGDKVLSQPDLHEDSDELSTVPSSSTTVKVQFYGESQCPFCRKFVTETWNHIWNDSEMKAHLDYEFVPWGNAYFSTAECGRGPYDPKQRACFYEKCLPTVKENAIGGKEVPPEDFCFKGTTIYQHSEKEGQVDIYESCIIKNDGIEKAVAFTYCAEGDLMDNAEMSAHELLMECAADADIDVEATQHCLDSHGKRLEIANAKKTPAHPGVPYVLVEGQPLKDPFTETIPTICSALKDKGVTPLPRTCIDNENAVKPPNSFWWQRTTW